jgi:NADH-quinone oxidoreductase subunit A
VIEYYPVYIYFAVVVAVTLILLGSALIYPSRKLEPFKYLPYESGIQTETNLLQERFPLRHYLVGLIFLVSDVEVIFLYPWAVIGKKIGSFAFYEMTFFLVALIVGLTYVWRKGGLQWD